MTRAFTRAFTGHICEISELDDGSFQVVLQLNDESAQRLKADVVYFFIRQMTYQHAPRHRPLRLPPWGNWEERLT